MEGATANLPRGRKPTFLHLNGERAGIIGISIRPSRTSIAVAALDTHFLVQESMTTCKDPRHFVTELVQRIRDLMKSHPEIAYEGIGVAVPGRVDPATNRLVFAPNLGWGSFDLKTPLEQGTGLSVELENAANACALAEFWSGRHPESVRNLVAVTISEGIGVGLILNGQLVRGSTGLAGEFGHVTIQPDGPLCRCGNRGCWEMCASNTAALRYYSESASGGRSSKGAAAPLSFDDLMRLAEQGQAKARDALDRMARSLGAGIAMLQTGLSPDLIVLIGEVTRCWGRICPIITEVIMRGLPTHSPFQVLPTDPDTQPRLRGTITLVLQKHFGAPLVA
jgi:predicted NBD/HSP70 family sugar kinase